MVGDDAHESHVTGIHLLVIVVIVQSIFLIGIFVLLLVNRARTRQRVTNREFVTERIAGPLQGWLVGTAPPERVAEILATLDPDEALAQSIIIATARAAQTQREEFARSIRGAPWVRTILSRSTSRSWWRRIDAARLLAIVGTPGDRQMLMQLLRDKHPAVQGVAASSLPVISDPDAVAFVLQELPEQPIVVKLYQFSMLKDTWWLTTPALLDRLVPDSPPALLETWISLAEAIGTPELLERVCTLSTHGESLVRVAVARALKKYFHPNAMDALITMLEDPDWRVRAVAARSLGTLGADQAVKRLAEAIGDSNWWVRFRSALALAQLGEPGRRALREARASADRYAAEMATMISGLSPGSVVELSES